MQIARDKMIYFYTQMYNGLYNGLLSLFHIKLTIHFKLDTYKSRKILEMFGNKRYRMMNRICLENSYQNYKEFRTNMVKTKI